MYKGQLHSTCKTLTTLPAAGSASESPHRSNSSQTAPSKSKFQSPLKTLATLSVTGSAKVCTRTRRAPSGVEYSSAACMTMSRGMTRNVDERIWCTRTHR
eukprot:1158358-Pelagomonas_calceolata.AAC.10